MSVEYLVPIERNGSPLITEAEADSKYAITENISSTGYTYSSGRITQMIEVIAGNNRITDWTYNTNGTLNTSSTTYLGDTKTTTYSYNSDGTLAGSTVT